MPTFSPSELNAKSIQHGPTINSPMKRLVPAIALILAIGLSAAQAERKHTVVIEATVIRIDTWGLAKLACGVAINNRLAEYKVDAVLSGQLATGDHLVAKHLACDWNELDELKPGDKVLVVAELLKHAEKSSWQPTFDKKAVDLMNQAKQGETTEVPIKSEAVLVQCNVKKVAKLIYSSNP